MNSGSLAVVYDMSYLKLELAVDELDISKVEAGQSVTITADAVEGPDLHRRGGQRQHQRHHRRAALPAIP